MPPMRTRRRSSPPRSRCAEVTRRAAGNNGVLWPFAAEAVIPLRSRCDTTPHDGIERAHLSSAMGKAERVMLILTAIVFMAMLFAVLIAPHVPFLAAGE